MKIFENSGDKSKDTPAKMLVSASLLASMLIFNEGENTKEGAFELMLFGTVSIFAKFRKVRPHLFNQFKDEYFLELHKFCYNEGIIRLLPCDFFDFIEDRLSFYSQQMVEIMTNNKVDYLPTKIAYNFYERPLTLNGGIVSDLESLMILRFKFKSLFEFWDNSVYTVIEDMNL